MVDVVTRGAVLAAEFLAGIADLAPVREPELDALWACQLEEWAAE